jgi:hypothetical protein
MGLSQNMANVTAHTTELANTLGVPPSIPFPGAAPSVPGGKEAKDTAEEASKQAGGGSQQAMQMMSQMGSMAAQIPTQIGQALMAVPQQMGQQLQQLSQPLQQLTSMFGSGGKADSLGAAGLPFTSFSNHPLAGGSGAGGGSGMVRAASLPGSGGSPLQTPQMANLVGTKSVSTAPAEGAMAGSTATAGAVPMAAGGGGMGGMAPMMGQRGESGGTSASLAVPAPLDYDLDEGDDDDDW